MPTPQRPLFGLRLGALRDLPRRDLLVRFLFGAAISTVAGIVSVTVGVEPGGILLAFPAILPATLTLIEKEEGERKAEDLDVGSILGATALFAFALVVWQYIDGGSAALVLLAAVGAWLSAAVLLYLLLRLITRRGPLHQAIAELPSRTNRARSGPPPGSDPC